MIAAFVESKNIMMTDPVNTNHHEAENVSEIGWPQTQQLRSQALSAASSANSMETGHFDFENEEGMVRFGKTLKGLPDEKDFKEPMFKSPLG